MREESSRGRGRIRVSLRMEAGRGRVGRGILRLRILRSRMLILRGRFRNVLLIIVREGIAILLIFRYVFFSLSFPFLFSSPQVARRDCNQPSFPLFFIFPQKKKKTKKKKPTNPSPPISSLHWGRTHGTLKGDRIATLQCSAVAPCSNIHLFDNDLYALDQHLKPADSYLCEQVVNPTGFNCTGPCAGQCPH